MIENVENGFAILLAEDEPTLTANIKSELEQIGYTVHAAFDGEIAEKLFFRKEVHLAILDINLPGKNGLNLCKIFRQHNKQLPILMLTALSEVDDKLDAFNSGADDYLVKPFHMKELIARIEVLLKRASFSQNKSEKIILNDLEIDLDFKTVKRAGNAIELTAKEFLLLTELAKGGGRVLSKQILTERVWGLNFDTGTNTIEVYISFLRAKIDKNYPVKLIHTKTGFGYYLSDKE
jgi:two-component system copper resistance phosphate regulon response regulator CusR